MFRCIETSSCPHDGPGPKQGFESHRDAGQWQSRPLNGRNESRGRFTGKSRELLNSGMSEEIVSLTWSVYRELQTAVHAYRKPRAGKAVQMILVSARRKSACLLFIMGLLVRVASTSRGSDGDVEFHQSMHATANRHLYLCVCHT